MYAVSYSVNCMLTYCFSEGSVVCSTHKMLCSLLMKIYLTVFCSVHCPFSTCILFRADFEDGGLNSLYYLCELLYAANNRTITELEHAYGLLFLNCSEMLECCNFNFSMGR